MPPDDPGNPSVDFHGEQRNNQTDASVGVQRHGKEAKLSYNSNLLAENRHNLIVNAELSPMAQPSGTRRW